MAVVATLVAAGSMIAGIGLSYWTDAPGGPSIVMVMALACALALGLALGWSQRPARQAEAGATQSGRR
jgi:ABC-type Mn2+/Zn2+ transport system permease subunit